MKITIESTSKIVHVGGVTARVWQGQTEAGVAVTCLIHRIAVDRKENCEQFERELQETVAPNGEVLWPLRMFLGDDE